jgi:hypothetical protein
MNATTMPTFIPAAASRSSIQDDALGPLSRIYADYENAQKAKKVTKAEQEWCGLKKRSRSADWEDGSVCSNGKKKKIKEGKRSGWSSLPFPFHRPVLKERRPFDTNVNADLSSLPFQKQCNHQGYIKIAQKRGFCHMHLTSAPCNFDGCTDSSTKDGLCKTHWCAFYICAQDGFSKKACSNGFCVEHKFSQTQKENFIKPDVADHEKEENFQMIKKKDVSGDQQFAQKKPCVAEGCTNQSVVNGVCFRHGAKRKLCDIDGCGNQSIRGGVCFRHGAKRKLCKAEGCTNLTQRKGLCIKHWALLFKDVAQMDSLGGQANGINKEEQTLCVQIPQAKASAGPFTSSSGLQPGPGHEDFDVVVARSVSSSSTATFSIDAIASASDRNELAALGSTTELSSLSTSCREECTCGVDQGVRCMKHKKRRKPCSSEGCTNQSVIGGICIKHGAKVKRCSYDGCDNVVQKQGLCRKHKHNEVEGDIKQGEKRDKCSHQLCTSAAVEGGVCLRHRALSSIVGSSSNPITSGGIGILTKTGRKAKHCKSEGCSNRSIQGGVCFRHGANAHRARCSGDGCKNYVVRGGLCIKHGANEVLKKSPGEKEGGEKNTFLKQEDDNSSVVKAGEKQTQDDLFKRIDLLEDNCADILLLLRKEG